MNQDNIAQAISLADKGLPRDGREKLENLLREGEKKSEVVVTLAYCYEKEDNIQTASYLYKAAIELQPENENLILARARCEQTIKEKIDEALSRKPGIFPIILALILFLIAGLLVTEQFTGILSDYANSLLDMDIRGYETFITLGDILTGIVGFILLIIFIVRRIKYRSNINKARGKDFFDSSHIPCRVCSLRYQKKLTDCPYCKSLQAEPQPEPQPQPQPPIQPSPATASLPPPDIAPAAAHALNLDGLKFDIPPKPIGEATSRDVLRDLRRIHWRIAMQARIRALIGALIVGVVLGGLIDRVVIFFFAFVSYVPLYYIFYYSLLGHREDLVRRDAQEAMARVADFEYRDFVSRSALGQPMASPWAGIMFRMIGVFSAVYVNAIKRGLEMDEWLRFLSDSVAQRVSPRLLPGCAVVVIGFVMFILTIAGIKGLVRGESIASISIIVLSIPISMLLAWNADAAVQLLPIRFASTAGSADPDIQGQAIGDIASLENGSACSLGKMAQAVYAHVYHSATPPLTRIASAKGFLRFFIVPLGLIILGQALSLTAGVVWLLVIPMMMWVIYYLRLIIALTVILKIHFMSEFGDMTPAPGVDLSAEYPVYRYPIPALGLKGLRKALCIHFSYDADCAQRKPPTEKICNASNAGNAGQV
jgi:hypothetical protein